MKVNFYLNGRKKLKNIHLIIIEKGKRKYFGLNLQIEKKYWDSRKQCAKTNFDNYEKFNKLLNKFKNSVYDIYYELRSNNPFINPDDIFNEVQKEFFSKEISFYEIWDEYLAIKALESRTGTIEKSQQLKKLMLEFEERHNTQITFNSIDMQFFDKFKTYMIEEKKYNANTIKKKFSFLKSFLTWAKSRKYHKNEDYQEFKVDGFQTMPNPLTYDELMTLVNLDLSKKLRLKKVRDLFVFACLTGQRISDFKNVSRSAVKKIDESRIVNFNNKIKYEWHLISQKEKQVLVIPLVDLAVQMLEENDYTFSISDAKFNEYLKEIGELANLDSSITKHKIKAGQSYHETKKKYELLSSKVARQTFITLWLTMGMPERMVREISGHVSEKEFMKYLKFHQEDIKQTMDNIWERNSKG